MLRKEPVGVVISNTELPDGTWKDLLNQSSKMSGAPNLIVMSRLADERLWADVLNRGGYDLLPMPCEAAEVVRIITQAWTDWERKRAVMAQNNPAVADSSVSYSEKMILAKGWRESTLDIPPGDKGQLQKDPLDLKSTTSSK